jgi:hypothetical protein
VATFRDLRQGVDKKRSGDMVEGKVFGVTGVILRNSRRMGSAPRGHKVGEALSAGRVKGTIRPATVGVTGERRVRRK